MKLANVAGRPAVLHEGGAIDVERASSGRFGADPQAIYDRWDEFREWAASVPAAAEPFDEAELGAPAPFPRQVFAIGLNYRDHAEESGIDLPQQPVVFTKFPSSVTGPIGSIELVDGDVDWEVELVAVIGRRAHRITEDAAWDHVAGVTVGQDVSERRTQLAGPAPQFSMGKSFPGFSPIGPWLVSPDELADPGDLRISCAVNGEVVQDSRTSELVFPVPTLMSRLSAIVPLLPGDLLFTGTPAGVGLGRTPQRYLQDGDELVSEIESIGRMRHKLVAGGAA